MVEAKIGDLEQKWLAAYTVQQVNLFNSGESKARMGIQARMVLLAVLETWISIKKTIFLQTHYVSKRHTYGVPCNVSQVCLIEMETAK